MGQLFWLSPNFRVFAWQKPRKLRNFEKWAYFSRRNLKNGYPFLPKSPLKMGRGFEAREAHPCPTQIWVPPGSQVFFPFFSSLFFLFFSLSSFNFLSSFSLFFPLSPLWVTGPGRPRTKRPMWRSPKRHNGQSAYEDYYDRQCGTPLHCYFFSIYTEVTVLLLWSSSNATLEYPHRYSNRVAMWVLHGNCRATSQEQHGYFSVGTNAVTV